MRIVLARLQSLKAVALSNEGPDSRSATLIDKMTALGVQVDIQLPEVLTPPAPLSDDPVNAAPAKSDMSPAEQVMETQQAPVPAVEAAPVEQVTPPPADALPNADGASQPVAEQGTENTGTPVPTVADGAPSGDGSAPTVASQSDPGDEDPTPADKETIASLDARVDALEGHPRGGKVSRQ